MLKSIRDYFDRNIGAQGAPAAERHSVELATAALLVEVVRSDADIAPNEQQAVLRAVRERFGLSDEEAQTLFRLAEDEVKRPLGDELLFGELENGGHVDVDAVDGKLAFRMKGAGPKDSAPAESAAMPKKPALN